MVEKESQQEFKIPLNFAQLIFSLISELHSPQNDMSYTYRVRRFEETLSPFMPAEFKAEYDKKLAEFDKRHDVERTKHDVPYRNAYDAIRAHFVFPHLVRLCEILGIIEFSTKKSGKVIG